MTRLEEDRRLVSSVITWVIKLYGLKHTKETVLKKFYEDHPQYEMVPIDIRKARFREKCLELRGDFPDDLLRRFFEYWTEANDGGKKMRFEKQNTFDIRKRAVTFWRNDVTQWGKFPEKWDDKESKPIGMLEMNQQRSWKTD